MLHGHRSGRSNKVRNTPTKKEIVSLRKMKPQRNQMPCDVLGESLIVFAAFIVLRRKTMMIVNNIDYALINGWESVLRALAKSNNHRDYR